ncbi:MAG: hypothetical protein D6757_04020 [Alphaproteobacteria bacterium]|nr:MAG: hypothetical protein D6757_04020 [Alphaproteobacteria bacterium]
MLKEPQDDEEVRRRLDGLIRARPGASYAAASRLLGRNHAYIQQYIRRGQPRRLSLEDTRRLAQWLDVPVSQLLPRGDGSDWRFAALNPGDLVLLTFIDSADETVGNQTGRSTIAGKAPEPAPNRANTSVSESGALPFPRNHLEHWLGRAGEYLALFRVDGDAMCPTLLQDDLVLIDTSVRRVAGDGLYLLGMDTRTPVLRRLTLSPCGREMTVACDNPAYRRWTRPAPVHLTILGRAIACLHRL